MIGRLPVDRANQWNLWICRGHTVRAVTESFQLAKDAGYKVVAHMMPDLPNVGMERDMEQFKEYFENPAYRSDGLKLYPTLVIRGTGACDMYCSGRMLIILILPRRSI